MDYLEFFIKPHCFDIELGLVTSFFYFTYYSHHSSVFTPTRRPERERVRCATRHAQHENNCTFMIFIMTSPFPCWLGSLGTCLRFGGFSWIERYRFLRDDIQKMLIQYALPARHEPEMMG